MTTTPNPDQRIDLTPAGRAAIDLAAGRYTIKAGSWTALYATTLDEAGQIARPLMRLRPGLRAVAINASCGARFVLRTDADGAPVIELVEPAAGPGASS